MRVLRMLCADSLVPPVRDRNDVQNPTQQTSLGRGDVQPAATATAAAMQPGTQHGQHMLNTPEQVAQRLVQAGERTSAEKQRSGGVTSKVTTSEGLSRKYWSSGW
jgi:hypothetical protein